MGSPRPLLSRRWMMVHALAVLAVATMVALGFWQLDRLGQRREFNRIVEANSTARPVEFGQVLPAGATFDREAHLYRRVAVTGRYDVEHEVLRIGGQHLGRPGYRVLTPLITEDGVAVIVDRGFAPLEIEEPAHPQTAPPEGTVQVVGWLRPSETLGFLGLADPPEGPLTIVHRVDLDRLAEHVPQPLIDGYVTLESQAPESAGPLPVPGEAPVLDEGPHLSYAVQWMLFAVVASITYGAYAWRSTHPRRRSAADRGPDAAAE